MKKIYIILLMTIFYMIFRNSPDGGKMDAEAGIKLAYKADSASTVPLDVGIVTILHTAYPDKAPSSVDAQRWQDTYARLLRGSSGRNFCLCDIDGDGPPELLIGGPSRDTYKYEEYDMFTYKNGKRKYLGTVNTVRSSGFWSDGSGSLFVYDYGAGEGGAYRYYMDNGVLCKDGEVHGYYFDGAGNYTEWFRGTDGSKVIVTEETRPEYESICGSEIELERYVTSAETISSVIYGEESNIQPQAAGLQRLRAGEMCRFGEIFFMEAFDS